MSERKVVKSSPVLARLVLLFLRSSARLPISWARACGGLLGGLCGLLPTHLRAVSDLNLRLCFPEMPAAERQRLVRRSLEETGKAILELGAMWHWPAERLAALEEEVDGEELLERSLARGRGTILLAPHIGNWEFLNHFLMRRLQLVYLYRPPRGRQLRPALSRAVPVELQAFHDRAAGGADPIPGDLEPAPTATQSLAASRCPAVKWMPVLHDNLAVDTAEDENARPPGGLRPRILEPGPTQP